MELAKSVALWRSRPPEQWLAELNRILPPVAAILLVVLIAYEAAGLTWRLLEQPADQDELPPVVRVAGGAAPAVSSDLSRLRDWEPFGRAPVPGAGEPVDSDVLIDAPLTRLDLTLRGRVTVHTLPERGEIVLVPESGWATIATGRNTAKAYAPGEEIEGTNGYTLHSVFAEQVMIQPPGGGSLEKLVLEETPAATTTTGRLNTTLPTRVSTAPYRAETASNTAAAAGVADAAVAAASTALAQHIRLSMHEEQGQMIGFRLEPRNDSPVMSQLGLEPGDVLTEVNGTPLTDIRNTAQVVQALSETAQASVVIRRNGNNLPMVINVGDIQRLAESLQ